MDQNKEELKSRFPIIHQAEKLTELFEQFFRLGDDEVKRCLSKLSLGDIGVLWICDERLRTHFDRLKKILDETNNNTGQAK